MKNFFGVLFAIMMAISSFGQGFPVKVEDATIQKVGLELRSNPVLIQRLYEEGFQLDGTFFKYPSGYLMNGVQNPEIDGGSVGSDASNVVLASQNVTNLVGKIHVLLNINLWASRDVFVHFNTGMINGGFRRVIGRYAYNDEKLRFVYPNGNIGATLRGTPDVLPAAPNNKVVVTGSWEVIKIGMDMNFGAAKTMIFFGDSNTEGSFYSIPATVNDLWHWKVRNYYRLNGNDVRLIDKSWAGKSSITYESYRVNGQLNLSSPPDIAFYDLSTNDTDAAVYQANVTNFLVWAKGNSTTAGVWPKAKIVILGPIPKRGQETLMDNLRTAGAAAVSAFNNPEVIYVNMKTCFDINNDANYSSPSTDGTHISPTGHTAKANFLIQQLQIHDEGSPVKFLTL